MNTVILVLFLVLGLYIIGSALMVVTVRDLQNAVSWLASTIAAVAAMFCLLEAPIVGIVQVLVAVVVIAMLFGYGVRLTANDPLFAARDLIGRWWLTALGALLLFALVLVPVLWFPGLPGDGAWPRDDLALAPPPGGGATTAGVAGIAAIGRSLMQEFVLPFELAAILLLVGIIGTTVIIRMGKNEPSAPAARKRIARIYSVE